MPYARHISICNVDPRLLLVLLCIGLSACAAIVEDPAMQLAQAYRKQSKESARLGALANMSCSSAAKMKVCIRIG